MSIKSQRSFEWPKEGETETERERKRFASKLASCISACLKMFRRKKRSKTTIQNLKK